MALLDILLYPHPTLREVCKDVVAFDETLHRLLDDMTETMYAANGVGLAAPQVGVTQRVIVIDAEREERGREIIEVINPVLRELRGPKLLGEEGCLSLPDLYEDVERYQGLTLEAQDRAGKPFTLEANDFLSIVIQHEVDHLNGVLFLDHLSAFRQSLLKRKMKKNYGGETIRRVGKES